MMRYEYNTYKTSDKLLDIPFLFVEISPSNWRAYILTDINYKMFSISRSDSITTIHRLTEHDESMQNKIRTFIRNNSIPYSKSTIHYICWSSKIKSLESMREVAKTWSEITSYYIRNGGSFQTIQPILKTKGIISL